MFKKYRVEYGDQFWTDLSEVTEHIAKENLDRYYADELTYKVFGAIDKIAERGAFARSAIYITIDKTDFYHVIVDSYIIFYTIHDDVMLVRRLIHGARDIPRML